MEVHQLNRFLLIIIIVYSSKNLDKHIDTYKLLEPEHEIN